MKRDQPRSRKRLIGGAIVLIVGGLCFLAATSNGMLFIQALVGVGGRPFSVGDATLVPGEGWLLVDHRTRVGEPHMRLGLFPSKNAEVPSGRFYSFKDTSRAGHVTFMELDDVAITRFSRNGLEQLANCHRLNAAGDRRLVQCVSNNQVLVYDLDRDFVVAVSPAETVLLEHVLAIVAK